MQERRYRGVLVLLLSSTLLAGCISRPNTSSSHADARSASFSGQKAAVPEVDKNLVEAHAHYVQGLIYEMDDQPDQAQDELAKAALQDPANTELVLELTRNYLQQKHPEKALELLVRATTVPGAAGALFARLGLVYSQLGRNIEAVTACQAAIKRSPESMEGYRTLFFVYLQQNKPKPALAVLIQAGRAPNSTTEFSIELAELYVALQRQAPSEKKVIAANALALLNRAASQNPTNLRLLTRLGDNYNELGDTTNAVKMYSQLLGSNAELPEVRINLHDKLARIYLRGTNYVKAAEQLRAIVHDDPTNPEAYYLLGTLADETRNPTDAADYFSKVILLSENFEQAYYDLARVQIDLNQAQGALLTLEKARKKFKVGFFAEVLSALAYEQQKDYTNAMSHFTAAEVIGQATDPKRLNSGFYFNEGAAYERAGKYDQAEECFEKSLSLAPNSAEALNYLGYMWADRGVKLEQAHELIQKAVKIEPNSAAYLDSLAWVLYKLNRPQEALSQAQKAIKLSDAPDPTLYEHLGDIYSALKQIEKAHEAYSKSLTAEPNEEVRKKLKEITGKTGP